MERIRYYSDELEKGMELLFFQPDTDKYEEAFELIQRACDRKEPDAFYVLSRCHSWGKEALQKDVKRFQDFIKEGIKAGSELCVLGAGENGLARDVSGVLKHSPQISVNRTKEAAFAGNVLAQYALGCFYLEDGVERYINSAHYFTYDYPEENNPDFLKHLRVNNAYEGLKWVLRAAGQGFLPAVEKAYEVYMGCSIYFGTPIIERDAEKAVAFAERMSETFVLRSDFCFHVSGGYRVAGNYQKMLEWLQRGAEGGSEECINRLAALYRGGLEGAERNGQKALELYRISAGKGSPIGLFQLAEYYFHGHLVEKDLKKAFELYLKAAEKEQGTAQYYVASYYRYGWAGVEQNYKECLRYAQWAVKNGCAAAKAFVGEAYLYAEEMNNGFRQNPQVAIRILNECVEQDDTALGGKVLALRLLGTVYQQGIGVAADAGKAAEYFRLAEEM